MRIAGVAPGLLHQSANSSTRIAQGQRQPGIGELPRSGTSAVTAGKTARCPGTPQHQAALECDLNAQADARISEAAKPLPQ